AREAVASVGRRGNRRLERGEAFLDPPPAPTIDAGLILTELGGEKAPDAQVVQRVDVARDDLRDRLNTCPLDRRLRNEPGLREARVEILDDRERLREQEAVVLERRDEPLRVHRPV